MKDRRRRGPPRRPLVALALLAAALPAMTAAGVRPAHGGALRIGVPAPPAATAPGAAAGAVELLVARALAAPLLERDGAGRLVPGALAEVPAGDGGDRVFRLRLRRGLRAADGRPLGAADVAAHLTSLLAPGAPQGWVALPILGAEGVLGGGAGALAGIEVLSPEELQVTLAFPLPELPALLATTAAALPGAGPFVAAPRAGTGGALLLLANEAHHEGRPYARAVELRAVDPRAAARLLASGELDLVLRPEAAGGRAGPALPALTVTVAALGARRLGPGAEPLRAALAAVDRAELARRFVRGPALPLARLAPAPAPAAPAPPPAVPRPLPARVAILCDASAPEQRALAERLQVKLFDRGVRAAVDLAPAARFRERLAAGDYDVALVSVPLLAPEPALAAAQLAFATRGPAAARRALESLAGLAAGEPAAAEREERLARELALVPLVASGWRASLGPALQGLAPGADGAIDLGDLWLLGGGGP